jgi:hypothetical protein
MCGAFLIRQQGRYCKKCQSKRDTIYRSSPQVKAAQKLYAKRRSELASQMLKRKSEIKEEIYKLFSLKTDWEFQCPLERRGAIISLLHELGVDWESANKMSHFTLLPSMTCDVPKEMFMTFLEKCLKTYANENK